MTPTSTPHVNILNLKLLLLLSCSFLATPLQCKDCHPLLGGVVDLGHLPNATDSAAPSLLELQSLWSICPLLSFNSFGRLHDRCCGLYLQRRGCHLPRIQYISRVSSTAPLTGHRGSIARLTLMLYPSTRRDWPVWLVHDCALRVRLPRCLYL